MTASKKYMTKLSNIIDELSKKQDEQHEELSKKQDKLYGAGDSYY